MLSPLKRYSDEVKKQAIKVYYSEMSGRSDGKMFPMSKANVFKRIKNERSMDKLED